MDEVEFRSFWMGTGAAAFVGGFVVSATSGVTLLVSSPSDREFRVAVALILLSVLVAVLGIWAIVAAVSERWLPGRKVMERREADRMFLLDCLGAFLGTGQHLPMKTPPATQVDCANWWFYLVLATKNSFGQAHANAMFSGAPASAEGLTTYETLQPVIVRLTSVIERFNSLKTKRGFTEKTARSEEWFTYLVAACPYKFLDDQ